MTLGIKSITKLPLAILIFCYSCNSSIDKSSPDENQKSSMNDEEELSQSLSEYEKNICDSLEIDTFIVAEIRKMNTQKIEPFHYSLGKYYENDKWIEANPIRHNGLVVYEENSASYNLVLSLKDKFTSKGYSIFLLENNFGIKGELDMIGILKTTDKFEVLSIVHTDGINYDIDNDSLISIIRHLDNKYSLDLIGASGDWCEFVIKQEPDSWQALAQEAYKICPDIVEQGTGTVKALEDELKRTGTLYFWWD